jgi:uncharacterized membrane protein
LLLLLLLLRLLLLMFASSLSSCFFCRYLSSVLIFVIRDAIEWCLRFVVVCKSIVLIGAAAVFVIGACYLVVPNIAVATVAVLLLLVIVVVSKFWCPMRLLSLPLLLSPVFLQQ